MTKIKKISVVTIIIFTMMLQIFTPSYNAIDNSAVTSQNELVETSNGEMESKKTNRLGETQKLFLVTFHDEDGNVLTADVPFYTGDGISYPSTATSLDKEGYTFVEWQDKDGNSINLNTYTPEFTTGTPEVNLYAKYKKITNDNIITYTVKYQTRVDGKLIDIASDYVIEIIEGETYVATSPVINGYELVDLAQTTVTVGENDLRTIIVEYVSNGELLNYTVVHKYQNLDGSYDEEKIIKATTPNTVVTAEAVNVPGFTVVGDLPQALIQTDGRTKLTVEYTRNRYHVTFNTDNGTAIQSQDGLHGETVSLNIPTDIVKEGYVLSGFTSDDGQLYTLDELKEPFVFDAKSVVFTATWEESTTTVSINYYVEKDGIVGEGDVVGHAEYYDSRGKITYIGKTNNKLSQAQLDDSNTWNLRKTVEVEALVSSNVTEIEGYNTYKNDVPDSVTFEQQVGYDTDIITTSYREFAKADYSDTVVQDDGSTVINFYYSNRFYAANFAIEPIGNSMSTSQIYSMTFEGNVYEHQEIGWPSREINQYKVYYKYGQDISDLWPHPVNGAVFEITEGYNFYGWQTASKTFLNHDGGRLTYVGASYKVGPEHIPLAAPVGEWGVSGTRLKEDSINFGAAAIIGQSEVKYYLEAIPGTESTSAVEFDGRYYELLSMNVMPGTNYASQSINGFTYYDKILVDKETTADSTGEKVDQQVSFFYNRNQYDINYEVHGGNEIIKKTYYYQELIDLNEVLIDATHPQGDSAATFVDWYTSADYSLLFVDSDEYMMSADNSAMFMPSENITIHAKWKLKDYTITYDFNNAQEDIQEVHPYGTNITVPTPDEYTGYIFDGWYYEKEDKYLTTGSVITENMTLVAQWRKVENIPLEVEHIYVDGDKTYTKSYTIENQTFGQVIDLRALTSEELIVLGWPQGMYHADNTEVQYTIKETANKVTFTYTKTAGITYDVICVDTDGNTLKTISDINTINQVVTVEAPEIENYAPIENIITKNIIDEANRTIVFVYENTKDTTDYNVNIFQLQENGTSVKLETLTIKDAKLGSYVNVLEENQVINALTKYEDLFHSDATVSTKYIAKTTEFNIYLYDISLADNITVEAISTTIQYDSNIHTLDESMFTVYVDGVEIKDLEKYGITLSVSDKEPSLGTSNNVLDTFNKEDVSSTNLWVSASTATKSSLPVAFSHTITPRPVTVVANSVTYKQSTQAPTLTYDVQGMGFIPGDDISIDVKMTSTPTNIGVYQGIIEALVSGSDISNYDITYVHGNVTIFTDTITPTDPTNPTDPTDPIVPTDPTVPTTPTDEVETQTDGDEDNQTDEIIVNETNNDNDDTNIESTSNINDDRELGNEFFGISKNSSWSLFDLLMTILTAVLALAYLIRRKRVKEEDLEGKEGLSKAELEDERVYRRNMVSRIILVLLFICNLILLILTQDFTQPMVFFDQYSIYFAIIAIVSILVALYVSYKRSNQDSKKDRNKKEEELV